MYTPQFISLFIALAAVSTVAAECHGEKLSLHCYDGPDDTPQNVDIQDISSVAKALRDYGREIEGGRYFTMTAQDAPDCAEWEIYNHQTALAVAKHVGSRKDSSVLFEDIANTIDGGQRHEICPAIVQCLTAGGSAGVIFNGSDVAYNTEEYLEKGYTPEGILIKLVSNVRTLEL